MFEILELKTETIEYRKGTVFVSCQLLDINVR